MLTANIVFCVVTTFRLSVNWNRHQFRIWGSNNPHAVVETARYTQKFNVFCAVLEKKMFGPLIFCRSHSELRRIRTHSGGIRHTDFGRSRSLRSVKTGWSACGVSHCSWWLVWSVQARGGTCHLTFSFCDLAPLISFSGGARRIPLYIFWVYVCSLSYSARKAHAP